MRFRRPVVVLGIVFAALAAGACSEAGLSDHPAASDSGQPAASTEESPVSSNLPGSDLQAIVDRLPVALDVPGALIAVSRSGERWIGTAGVDDLEGETPVRADGRFRAASITKLFTATVVMGLVEAGELSLDDALDRWFPDFPHAEKITIEMLLSHTGGVTSDWWQQPEIAQLALDDLGRTWTPAEVLGVMAGRPVAGPPGGASLYSNTGYILLGEIAAEIGGAPIGELIEQRIIRPLGLHHTSYRYDPPPGLLHGYFEFHGVVLDTTTTDVRALTSMAGAAGAIHTTAADLLTFLDTLMTTDRLLEPSTTASMRSTDWTSTRWGLAFMAYCPCSGTGRATAYSGWGHTGDLPGHYSVAVHFPVLDASVVVFINKDTVDGQPVDHTYLDATVEQLAYRLELQVTTSEAEMAHQAMTSFVAATALTRRGCCGRLRPTQIEGVMSRPGRRCRRAAP